MNEQTNQHQQIVSSFLNAKAVDFEAIGKMVAEIGPSRAVASEPWEEFCWTMRHFIRVYRMPDPRAELADLKDLRELGGNLRG